MSALLEKSGLPPAEAIQAELARRYLRNYIRQAWPIIEPATEYLHNWHIDAMSEYLEAVTSCQITRLLINIPPRYMKSITVSVMWPTWEWIRFPEYRYLFSSYSSLLSTKHSLDRRNIIESEWYRAHFGDSFFLTSDQNVKTEYKNNKQGVMVSTGVGGSATGKGGNRVVVDDPHNPQGVESDLQRDSDLRFFDKALSTRLNDKRKGAIVVVMQRLHEKDVSARCLELGYTHLNLPSEAEGRTVISLPSGREIVREDGDLLWPEREGPKELDDAKRALGSYGYAGQYQQRPSPVEGGILKRHWWQYWKLPGVELPPVSVRQPDGSLKNYYAVDLPADFAEQLQSWDLSFKDEKAAKGGKPDYVVGQAWGKSGANRFLLDQVRDRLDFPATCAALLVFSQKWPLAFAKLIEDKANGPAIIATLRNKLSGLIAVEPKGGKVARINSVAPQIESGNVYLPHPLIAPWVNDFIERSTAFPNAANDDEQDAMSQALLRLAIEFDDESDVPGTYGEYL